jgi:hypothetical protein
VNTDLAAQPTLCGPAPACRTWTCAGALTCTVFDIEHTYRFARHGLGWDKAALRYPAQVQRWTWLIIAALTMLRLARPVAEDCRNQISGCPAAPADGHDRFRISS